MSGARISRSTSGPPSRHTGAWQIVEDWHIEENQTLLSQPGVA
ncbi:hypothetical protein [Streptomyces rubrogriseus]|nr:hypothetical protein [Streptomyces rubrogriseus]